MKPMFVKLLSTAIVTLTLFASNDIVAFKKTNLVFQQDKNVKEINDAVVSISKYFSIIQFKKTDKTQNIIKILELKTEFLKNLPEYRNIDIRTVKSGLDSFIKYFENDLIRSIHIDIILQHKLVNWLTIHIKNFIVHHIIYIN